MNEDEASAADVGEDEDSTSVDDDNEVTVISNAQEVYVHSNNSKKQLFLMCVGLSEGGTNIFDLDADPWRFRNFGFMAVLYTVESRCKRLF
jgi:hypothetical protein